MNKKLLIVVFTACLIFVISSCGKNKLTGFDKLVNDIYASEAILAGYDEAQVIYDEDMEIYHKDTSFKLIRNEKVISEVNILEKKLSTSGTSIYDIVSTKYRTIDNVKYTVVDGTTYENAYTVPTYYLTFVLSKDFLKEGYDLNIVDDTYTLKAQVLDNKISSLFLNKSLGNIYDMSIEIVVDGGKLKSFNASYKSPTGFDSEISTTYEYAEKGTGKAVFYLEGGVCQNSHERVTYLYNFNGTVTDMLIKDPNVLETNPNDMILKSGYHIEGWYKTKTTNPDGTITYSDKWDFDKDRMTLDGVVLYAKWEENRTYKYELYYKDSSGNDVFLDGYECKEGAKFNDTLIRNKTVAGFTSLGYLDEQGNPWNSNYKHPGGDADLTIKVYLDLIEGEYTVVKTARAFKNALSRNQNIYLYNDIDFDEDEINFGDYSGTILGNGYTVSNFTIGYDDSRTGLKGELTDLTGGSNHLYVSLFFKLENAVIKDLTFKDAIVDIDTRNSQIKYLVFAPLAIVMNNTTLENVVFTGSFDIVRIPECEKVIITDKFCYQELENVEISESSNLEFENKFNK